MKKALLFFSLLVLLPACMRAQQLSTDKIVISDLATDDYGVYFTVGLEGSRLYTALNMDITMPEGISVADYEGEPDVAIYDSENTVLPFTTDKRGNKTWKHNVACTYGIVAPRMLRIACYSDNNDDFASTLGDLFIIYVEVDEEQLAASFCPKPIVTVSGIALVESDNTKHVPADFTCRPFASVIPAERTLPLNISRENQIGTLILPFGVDALPQGVKAYAGSTIDEAASELLLTPVTKLDACTPYIVYAPNGYTGTLTGTVDMMAEYPATDVYSQGFLTGVLSTTVVNDGYIMQNQEKGEGPMFYNAEGSSFALPAGRCYLTLPTSFAAKAVRMRIEGTTGFDNIEIINHDSQILYDLAGRRVENPTSGGIYISNGKKIVVK